MSEKMRNRIEGSGRSSIAYWRPDDYRAAAQNRRLDTVLIQLNVRTVSLRSDTDRVQQAISLIRKISHAAVVGLSEGHSSWERDHSANNCGVKFSTLMKRLFML
jgi:hypothetical protein